MRISRIHTEHILVSDSTLTLPAETAHYLANVLRARVGQSLVLFDGRGSEASATIQSLDRKQLTVQIGAVNHIDRESPLPIHLAIGISRGERMDFVLQKSTELGVTAITPLFCERTEVKLSGERLQKKHEHWQKVLISACEQCGRNTLPVLHESQALGNFLRADNSPLKLVLHHRSEHTLAEHRAAPASISLLIGPEGGLSEDEIARAITQGYTQLTLGPRVLRTETAPLVALSVLQHRWGDLDRR